MTGKERQVAAIRADARRSLPSLYAARRRLLADADDPTVLSELIAIEHQISHALQVTHDGEDGPLDNNDRIEASARCNSDAC
jgi:hypothetical protein